MTKVLVFPRSATNPYQDLLYGAMPPDVKVAYYPHFTVSQTMNILLFPLVLLSYRLRGYRLLHVHWTYPFAPVWAPLPGARRIMHSWYTVCLASARIMGYSIVWTAHNVLPLGRVFHDEVAARRQLARASSVVIVHNKTSIPAIRAFGAQQVEYVPFGPYTTYASNLSPSDARRRLKIGPKERVAVFFGVMQDYKGVDFLLEAVGSSRPKLPLRLVIAGSCPDAHLRRRLEALADGIDPPVISRFERIPDDDVQTYMLAADVAVLPFRRITNSSSLLLALSFGLPVVIPALPELDDVPEGAAFRYQPGEPAALAAALRTVAMLDEPTRISMSACAYRHVSTLSWDTTASLTRAVYLNAVTGQEPANEDLPGEAPGASPSELMKL